MSLMNIDYQKTDCYAHIIMLLKNIGCYYIISSTGTVKIQSNSIRFPPPLYWRFTVVSSRPRRDLKVWRWRGPTARDELTAFFRNQHSRTQTRTHAQLLHNTNLMSAWHTLLRPPPQFQVNNCGKRVDDGSIPNLGSSGTSRFKNVSEN